MANTFKDIGGKVCLDGYDEEKIISLIADGTAKAGYLVGQTAGDGTARSVNATGNLDEFDGIQLPRYDTDLNTAPTAGKVIDVLVPKANRTYNIAVYLAAAAYSGEPMKHNTGQAGMLEVGGDLEAEHVARLAKNAASGDNWAAVTWGA